MTGRTIRREGEICRIHLGHRSIPGRRASAAILSLFRKEGHSLSVALRNDFCTFLARMMVLVMPDLMMKNFESTETEAIWKGEVSRKFSLDIQKRLLRKLFTLDKSKSLDDLRISPANRLEPIKGDLESR